MPDPITVDALLSVDQARAWSVYTDPAHITGWNFASPDWHCPDARADLRAGGQFCFRMEARDGSAGFDFEGHYLTVTPISALSFDIGGRKVDARFTPEGAGTRVSVRFDPETEYPLEMQREGWQAILDSYKAYAERL